jgi:hypothetical protein
MRAQVRKAIEWLAVGLMLFGIFSLCQPLAMALYQVGFQILLGGLILFIVITHVKA